jgi:hypothetical protein
MGFIYLLYIPKKKSPNKKSRNFGWMKNHKLKAAKFILITITNNEKSITQKIK